MFRRERLLYSSIEVGSVIDFPRQGDRSWWMVVTVQVAHWQDVGFLRRGMKPRNLTQGKSARRLAEDWRQLRRETRPRIRPVNITWQCGREASGLVGSWGVTLPFPSLVGLASAEHERIFGLIKRLSEHMSVLVIEHDIDL